MEEARDDPEKEQQEDEPVCEGDEDAVRGDLISMSHALSVLSASHTSPASVWLATCAVTTLRWPYVISSLNEMRRADSRAAAVGTQVDGEVGGFIQSAEGGGTGD